MSIVSTGVNSLDIPFTDSDFQELAKLAKMQFGLNLSESKKPLVYSRLSKRLKVRDIRSFPEYLSLLAKAGEENEKFELISALTTNVTSFFRESHHFDTMRQDVLPSIMTPEKQEKKIRFWSAGCSAGPEPYSIAMTVLDKFPNAALRDVKILATDIDPKIVTKARLGQYPIEDLAGIPPEYREKWTTKIENGRKFTISNEIRKIITFNELNLISKWPMQGSFDAIFCRNVAIYFDQMTQQRLWSRFCDILNPHGVLFIGHSERVTGPATGLLEGIGITSYRKVNTPAASTQE